MPSQIGLIGLAVMGANLARNVSNHGFPIIVYNRTPDKTHNFIKQYGNDTLQGSENLPEFIEKLTKPHRIILMVKAGAAVDSVIQELVPFLEPGDILIDGGNSHFRDTKRRYQELQQKQIHYIGCGVSGGESGALNGPSLMPGGSETAYQHLRPIFEAIAARDFHNQPCVNFLGQDASGHYVKMIHNGIEYSIMAMIAEAYDCLRQIYQLTAGEISEIFEKYHKSPELESFLFEISIPVLKRRDDLTDSFLIDQILDSASQKGTGRWTASEALERSINLSSIISAVFSRLSSSNRSARLRLHDLYSLSKVTNNSAAPTLQNFIIQLKNALSAGIICSYAQGLELIQKTAIEETWPISLAEVTRIWQGGCIIRARILETIEKEFRAFRPEPHLLELPTIIKSLKNSLPDWQNAISIAHLHSVPIPTLSSALDYFITITSNKLPANFIQGLRDYFGAHTYERSDRTGAFHTDWDQ